MKAVRLLIPGALALLLTGCGSTGGVTDDTAMDGPVFGKKDETAFVAGSDGSPVSVGNIAAISKTIRKHKNLGAGEQEILRRVASLKLDGLIAGEMRKLAPQFEQKIAAVRQRTQSKIATVRRQAASGQKPASAVENEVVSAKAEESAEIAKVEIDWKSAARAEVAKNYGSDFAVPVSNAEGKAVVAFTSVKESGISISSASYELSGTGAQLSSAAASGRKITHEGHSYALLDTRAVLQ